jgi:hypothetical protein
LLYDIGGEELKAFKLMPPPTKVGDKNMQHRLARFNGILYVNYISIVEVTYGHRLMSDKRNGGIKRNGLYKCMIGLVQVSTISGINL